MTYRVDYMRKHGGTYNYAVSVDAKTALQMAEDLLLHGYGHEDDNPLQSVVTGVTITVEY